MVDALMEIVARVRFCPTRRKVYFGLVTERHMASPTHHVGLDSAIILLVVYAARGTSTAIRYICTNLFARHTT